ncbi:hypothetical protein BT96DRAFT_985136 [Gymnopus androsaceus JB14]|uniref:Secreted protein n=1 Tax=Gymnopus androsaceus JB14 TaxID=1447944 RepID=A0A6A4IFS2_9AGAR|nr:hypothetical protein BT96DRAFT_985136 [Gymnopus androsaceus JB14]
MHSLDVTLMLSLILTARQNLLFITAPFVEEALNRVQVVVTLYQWVHCSCMLGSAGLNAHCLGDEFLFHTFETAFAQTQSEPLCVLETGHILISLSQQNS